MEEDAIPQGASKRTEDDYLQEIGVEEFQAQPTFEDELEAKYLEECEKRRKRAERFGQEFVPPSREELFPEETKMARLLKLKKPGSVFAVGFDLKSEEERERRAARAQRFGVSTVNEDQMALEDETEERHKKEARANRFGVTPSAATYATNKSKALRELKLNPYKLYVAMPLRKDVVLEDGFVEPDWMKVHIYAIDLPVFKFIKSADLMAFFTGYGPLLVQWLGDHAANVVFADRFAAERALEQTSIVLPTLDEIVKEFGEPDERLLGTRGDSYRGGKHRRGHKKLELDLVDLPAFGWRLGRKPVVKVTPAVEPAAEGAQVRVLMRIATTNDKCVKDQEKNETKLKELLAYQIERREAKRKRRANREEEKEDQGTAMEVAEEEQELVRPSKRRGGTKGVDDDDEDEDQVVVEEVEEDVAVQADGEGVLAEGEEGALVGDDDVELGDVDIIEGLEEDDL